MDFEQIASRKELSRKFSQKSSRRFLWRHRRLIVAEGAEVQSEVEFLEWGQQNRQFDQPEPIDSLDPLTSLPGLIWRIKNPHVLTLCLTLLLELRESIK